VEVPAGHLLDEPIAVTRVGGHLLMRVRTPASCHKPPFRIIAATSSAIGVRHLPRPVDGRFVGVYGELCSGCGLLEAGEQYLA
jgi:hypothetical protein